MPYKECLHRTTLPKLVNGNILERSNKEWLPTSSQLNANERMGFQSFCDNMSGGIQYWHKKIPKQAELGARHSKAKCFNTFSKLLRHPKCVRCGGFLGDPVRLLPFMNSVESAFQCAFGREYCDVIGPCADCCLLKKRNAIVEKHGVEFPGLEVTPERLVAPALVQVMMNRNRLHDNEHHQGRSVLELPPISPDTLKYMQREAGSSKQKRKLCFTDQKNSIKKYIEIRLPNI